MASYGRPRAPCSYLTDIRHKASKFEDQATGALFGLHYQDGLKNLMIPLGRKEELVKDPFRPDSTSWQINIEEERGPLLRLLRTAFCGLPFHDNLGTLGFPSRSCATVALLVWDYQIALGRLYCRGLED